jgi:iron complex transport system permease protein
MEIYMNAIDKYKKFVGKKMLFIVSLLALVILLSGLSTSFGSAGLTFFEVYTTILHRLVPDYSSTTWLANVVVWDMRFPRIILGILAGMGLGIAGAVMQAVLKNPLASPFTLGISSAAGFGAAVAIIMGSYLPWVDSRYLIIICAFLSCLITMLFIYGLATFKGATPETMILAGVALMYLFSAMLSILQYLFASEKAIAEVVFWMFGSLGKATWGINGIILVTLAVSIPILILKSWDLNVMTSGDEAAKGLGVKVKQIRMICFALASLMTAVIICFTGIIGFVGLVSPHICRMIIGADNRFLIPASGLLGALLLLSSDLVARTIIDPVIIPVGIMTSFLGVPLFMYLMMNRKREYF